MRLFCVLVLGRPYVKCYGFVLLFLDFKLVAVRAVKNCLNSEARPTATRQVFYLNLDLGFIFE